MAARSAWPTTSVCDREPGARAECHVRASVCRERPQGGGARPRRGGRDAPRQRRGDALRPPGGGRAVGRPAAPLRPGALPVAHAAQPALGLRPRRPPLPVLRRARPRASTTWCPAAAAAATRGTTWSPPAGRATCASATATCTRRRCGCGTRRPARRGQPADARPRGGARGVGPLPAAGGVTRPAAGAGGHTAPVGVAEGWAVRHLRGEAGELHLRPLPAAPEREVWVLAPVRPALVLGSTQPEALVDLGEAARLGVDVVRRRSGGGVVMVGPDDPLWVDVVLPAGDPLWHDDVGRAGVVAGRGLGRRPGGGGRGGRRGPPGRPGVRAAGAAGVLRHGRGRRGDGRGAQGRRRQPAPHPGRRPLPVRGLPVVDGLAARPPPAPRRRRPARRRGRGRGHGRAPATTCSPPSSGTSRRPRPRPPERPGRDGRRGVRPAARPGRRGPW